MVGCIAANEKHNYDKLLEKFHNIFFEMYACNGRHMIHLNIHSQIISGYLML
jgi:hypothetical protein